MSSKTKKIKQKKKKYTKQQIWKTFDNDQNMNSSDVKCIYMTDENENIEYCEMCNSSLAFNDENLLMCSNNKCGIIYNNLIDSSAEWRYYSGSDSSASDPTRCGMPINPLLEESSYGCKILCPAKSSYEMRKIKRYTAWQSMPYREKSNYDDFSRIKTMASNAGISKLIVDEALRYHKNIIRQKTFRGINRDGIIAASIYISCRINNNPRTPKELATIFNLDNSSATKGCKNAIKLLNSFESQMNLTDKTEFITAKPISFIERFCSKLNINDELTKVCLFITTRIEALNLVPEKAPQSVAAGVIYFVIQTCKLNISKIDIHNISEISEVTINKCYKKLTKIHTSEAGLIPTCILNKYQ